MHIDDHIDMVDITTNGARDLLVSLLTHYSPCVNDETTQAAPYFFLPFPESGIFGAGAIDEIANAFLVDRQLLVSVIRQLSVKFQTTTKSLYELWISGEIDASGDPISTALQNLQLLLG
jgi:hypothetical protein